MINIALSTDQRGFAINATLIASILRRASRPVHVRCWCRGFLAESFETGPLKVEFLAASGEAPGKYPLLSGPAAYDRLLVIRDCPDWDRCMVMDYDQLVLCDLAPLFDLDLGDHLLAEEKFTYEARESSAACVRRHEGEHYFAGAVQGGAREEFFMAADAMAQAIGRDRKAGISAIWHAESHWNRVLVDMPPTVVLSPAYGRPEGQATEFAAKILMSREGAEMDDAPSPPRHARRHGYAGMDCRDGMDADNSEDARLADTLARITGWVRVVSLPERDDRRRELCANWEPFGFSTCNIPEPC
jgi:hypothetical protein